MGKAGSRDDVVEVLIAELGGVGSKGLVGGPIRQLGKVIIPVQDDNRVALISGENEDVVGAERAKCRFLGFGETGLLWDGGWKFGIRDIS